MPPEESHPHPPPSTLVSLPFVSGLHQRKGHQHKLGHAPRRWAGRGCVLTGGGGGGLTKAELAPPRQVEQNGWRGWQAASSFGCLHHAATCPPTTAHAPRTHAAPCLYLPLLHAGVHNNLWSNIELGRGTRPFASSGDSSRGAHAGGCRLRLAGEGRGCSFPACIRGSVAPPAVAPDHTTPCSPFATHPLQLPITHTGTFTSPAGRRCACQSAVLARCSRLWGGWAHL